MDTPSLQTSPHSYVLASRYDFDSLATIYNEARVDYIVPMPMNGKRMKEYVEHYDVNLDASVVSLNDELQETGIGMLGLRADRAWITRLGVIPYRRRSGAGRFVTEALIEQAQRHGVRLVQLEVIKGNTPAIELFGKLGFQHVRELLILRRPPGKPDPALAGANADTLPLSADEIFTLLNERVPGAAWTEESTSLLNTHSLDGMRIQLPSGEEGWIIYQRMTFQLGHLIFNTGASDLMLHTLLYHLHNTFPMQDTKLENIAADDPACVALRALGYVESFRRYEMCLEI